MNIIEVDRKTWNKAREITRGDFCIHPPESDEGQKEIRFMVYPLLGIDLNSTEEYNLKIKELK